MTDVLAPQRLAPRCLKHRGPSRRDGSSRADWREGSVILLNIDPDREPDRAPRAFDTHLARAKWMTHTGYRLLLRTGAWPSQLSKRWAAPAFMPAPSRAHESI